MDRGLSLLQGFFINAPYELFRERYLDFFLSYRLNPELYFSPQLLDKWPEDEFKALAQELKSHALKVTFHAPFFDLSPGALDEKIRQATEERLKQVLELIPIFTPYAIVTHLGFDPRIHDSHKKEWLESSLKTWQELMPLAERYKVNLNWENVFEPDPELFLALLQRLSSPFLGVCFDLGHVFAFTRSTLSKWETLFPYIKQLHLHDNHGHRDEHLGLGKGNIDFLSLFSKLKQYDRYPLITLEPHTEEAFWDSLKYLNTLPDKVYCYLKRCSVNV